MLSLRDQTQRAIPHIVRCDVSSVGAQVHGDAWGSGTVRASTASRTLGMRPPRELRSVAILLTLTRGGPFRLPSAQLLLDHVHDVLGPRAKVSFVLAFEHHAQQRFGP